MKQLSTQKPKKIMVSILLWIATIISSVIAKKIIIYFHLDAHKPLTVLFAWLSVGLITLMFFLSIINIFKEKLGKLYSCFAWFLIILWTGGLIFIMTG